MFLHLAGIYFTGNFYKIILNGLKHHIHSREMFTVILHSTILNNLTPFRGGAAYRALYLKNKHKVGYTEFFASLAGYHIVLFYTLAIQGIIGLVAIYFLYGVTSILLTGFFVSIVIVGSYLYFMDQFMLKDDTKFEPFNKFAVFVNRIITGWNVVSADRKLLGKFTLSLLAFNLVYLIITFIEFYALSLDINIWYILIYSSISGLGLVISITPGSLGIREAMLLIFATSLVLSQSDILNIAVLDRGSYLLLLFIALVFERGFKLRIGNG